MKRLLVVVLLVFSMAMVHSEDAIIIDHNFTDLSGISPDLIEFVKNNIKWHYAHTSHGEQLRIGLERLEGSNPFYAVEFGDSCLPDLPAELCVFDGQENDTYITPDMYWETDEGMQYTRDVLNHNPSINVSAWCWCTQCDYYSQEQIREYLNRISQLEAEFPDVYFVYMTGNAQGTDYDGYNRWLNNEIIRDYCRSNGKILFDFADLDAWWYNPETGEWEFSSYEYEGHTIPVEHPHFHGDEGGHTTFESCDQKGRAVWWLMAKIAERMQGNPTPTPSHTPTEGPTYTPTPPSTPTPSTKFGVELLMPSDYFKPGDTCWLKAYIYCPYENYGDALLFVFLDVYGEYYFYPSWKHYPPDIDYEQINLQFGEQEKIIIDTFNVPSGIGNLSNLIFYGALTDLQITKILGEYSEWHFSFGE